MNFSKAILIALLLATVLLEVSCLDLRHYYGNWTRTGPAPTIRRSGKLPSKFDFIIVGAGTAGCVVANRLSANPRVNVLVIEAGGYYDDVDLVSIPINWDLTPYSPLDWSMLNEGIEPVVSFGDDQKHIAAGKALGGTTVINTMMYVRGNHEDYNAWNMPGWSYEEVLPFFKKAETSPRYYEQPDGQTYHGNNGPIKIGPSGWQPQEDMLLVEAANNAGLPFNPDWNGASQIGVGFHEHTIDNGKRVTSFGSYLKPVLNRKNLWVMDRSLVHRIIFTQKKNKPPVASSVVFVDNLDGSTHTVSAKKEIIISAGALKSPQLLMVSGIGPADELQRIGVPIVKDLPGVGQNLHDHPTTSMLWFTGVGAPVVNGTADQAAFDLYLSTHTGIVASITARTNFFFRSDYAVDSRPDGQIIVTPPGFATFNLVYLNRPRSRGSLKLFSADITDGPRVTANYYSHPDDLLAMMDIMNKTAQILRQPPVLASAPQNDAYNMSSEEALRNYILSNTGSGYHFVGTCKMGPSTDPMAVVDAHLRVYGVNGLRVVDASIMPEITSGNTQAPTYMIGERAAAFILSDNNLQ